MDEIEEIKRRIDIVDLISSYLTLKKAGTSYKALCPFHQEKVPSFYVSPEKQIFKCFGCGKSGDIFDFLMEMENLEFIDALKLLAEKAGVQLKRLDKKEYKEQKEEKTKLYEINSWAAKFFHKILIGKPKAQFVRDYLKARQISQNSIQDFMLGYAPDSYNMLSNFLESKGYSKLDIHNSGLTVESDKKPGEYYDRFRDRLMFPIFDVMGNVIAFTGRAMRETEAGKYVNSPDTPIYSKSRVLYGLDKAKKAIKEKNKVIIVEGQMDVIATHQRGYKNVVASSGTALTPFQLETISRFTKNLTFAFDQDKAGEEATKRGIDLAHRAGFDVKIILTPKGKDPDECLRENPKLWEKAVSEEKGAMDYYFEIAFSKRPKELDASSKREIAAELLPVIRNLSDQIVQSHYIQKLAELLNTPEKFLFEALEKIKKPVIQQPQKSQPKPPPSIEERLLGLILAKPEFQSDFFKKVNIADFQNPKFKEIVQNLQKYYNQTAVFNLNSFKKKIPQYSTEIDLLVLPFENITDADFLKKEYNEYVTRFLSSKTEKVKKFYEEKIKEAEKLGDKTKVKELIKEFQKEIIGK
jgi:DNA primase